MGVLRITIKDLNGEAMMKRFKVKFSSFCCDKCYNKLFVYDIYKRLQEQYEDVKNVEGYVSILFGKCEGCGQKYKIYCDCHDKNNIITVCVNHIVEVNI